MNDITDTEDLLKLFATCPRGVEYVLLEELRGLGALSLRETPGGVHFSGKLELLYRVCLWSRCAARILLPLTRFELQSTDTLFEASLAIDWPEIFDARYSFLIEVAGHSHIATHTHFAALRVKDGIVDKFRAKGSERPDVAANNPDIRIHLHLDGNHAQIALDLSGESLHKRGYRSRQLIAPLKENLAAALLLRAGWPAMAAQGAALLDPLCGSGTLPIEAAWIAGDVAPGILRETWGFSHWNEHQPKVWRLLHEEALARREAGLKKVPLMAGRDVDPQAISIARDNGKRAGLTGKVDWTVADATTTLPLSSSTGLVICNPPYGERLADEAELVKLHSLFGAHLKHNFPGWRIALFTGRPDLGHRLGMRAEKMFSFYNGALPCKLLLIDVHAAQKPVTVDEHGAALPASEITPVSTRKPVAEDFANRLRKNYKHLAKWAERKGVSNYRVYDADLPDYAVAVDCYHCPELNVVVQEYAPPKTIEVATAERRLREAFHVIQEVLAVPSARLHYKLRKSQKGTSQYTKQSQTDRYQVVNEHGAQLWVNFNDYLDTGLFLDHRPIRQKIKAESAGKAMLNLFCYTGAATVQAALGGASKTVSVDLSNTYLDWLVQNLELNQFSCELRDAKYDGHKPLNAQHTALRADCTTWVAEQAGNPHAFKYDLIFCDPPTFSNSKKMEDIWDIQRDHAELLQNAAALLTPDGVLYFSTNRQRFKLDTEALDGLVIKDISNQTLEEDFKRPPPVHRCWRITRS